MGWGGVERGPRGIVGGPEVFVLRPRHVERMSGCGCKVQTCGCFHGKQSDKLLAYLLVERSLVDGVGGGQEAESNVADAADD